MLTTSKKFTFIQIFKFLLTEVEKIILMNTGVDVIYLADNIYQLNALT